MPLPIIIAVAGFVALCAAIDVRQRRIPNALSGTAILLGAAVNVVYFGSAGALASFAGLVLGGAMLLAPFALGGVGAGDVKMLGAVGALVGPQLVFVAGIVGMALGGLVMGAHLLLLGRFGETLAKLSAMVRGAVTTRSTEPLRVSAEDRNAVTLPYSVPLGLGTVVALLCAGG